jgi:hypothetical protein
MPIEINAVVVGPPGQGEHGVFKIEMVNDAALTELLGQLLGGLPGRKGIDYPHGHQIIDPDFHGQPATPALTPSTEPLVIFGPGSGLGQIDKGIRSAFHQLACSRGLTIRLVFQAADFNGFFRLVIGKSTCRAE